MAFSSKLADLIINFVSNGVEKFQATLEGVHKGLESVKDSAAQVGKVATAAFLSGSLSIAAFVRSGLQGSAAASILSYRFQELSRNIAGLFMPEIQRVIDGITRVVQWFRSLTDEQRANIARWLEAGIAAAFVLAILPRVIGAVQLLVAGVRALTAAMIGTGWGAILPILGTIASLFIGMGVATEVASGGIGKLFAAFKPLLSAISAVASELGSMFESVMANLQPVFDSIIESVVELTKSFAPVFVEVARFVGELVTGLAPILAEIIKLQVSLMKIMAPIIELVVTLARVLLAVLTPVLKVIAFILGLIAKLFDLISQAIKKFVDNLKSMMPEWLRKWVFGEDKKLPGPATTGGRGAVAPSFGGFEAVEAAYKRIAAASIQLSAGKGVDQKQLEQLEAINTNTEATQKAVGNLKPAVA